MSVRVVDKEEVDSGDGDDYIRVSTCADPNDDTVTLATIQRIVEKVDSERESRPRLYIKTLVMECPMSASEAVGLATCYAERKKIPVVYANSNELQHKLVT